VEERAGRVPEGRAYSAISDQAGTRIAEYVCICVGIERLRSSPRVPVGTPGIHDVAIGADAAAEIILGSPGGEPASASISDDEWQIVQAAVRRRGGIERFRRGPGEPPITAAGAQNVGIGADGFAKVVVRGPGDKPMAASIVRETRIDVGIVPAGFAVA